MIIIHQHALHRFVSGRRSQLCLLSGSKYTATVAVQLPRWSVSTSSFRTLYTSRHIKEATVFTTIVHDFHEYQMQQNMNSDMCRNSTISPASKRTPLVSFTISSIVKKPILLKPILSRNKILKPTTFIAIAKMTECF